MANTKLTPEMDRWFLNLKEPERYTFYQLLEKFKKHFNIDIHESCVRKRLKKLGISYMPVIQKWTPQYDTFLVGNIAKVRNYKELTDKLNAKFNTNMTQGAVENRCRTLEIKRPENTGCFKKGQKGWNYGTKGLVKPNSGSFKKGNQPKNHKPVGTESLRKDVRKSNYLDGGAYWWIKVAEPNKWELKQRVVYEAYTGHKPKTSEAVIFKNRDHNDFSIENLALVSREELFYINSLMGGVSSSAEITDSMILNAKLLAMQAKKKKEKKNVKKTK